MTHHPPEALLLGYAAGTAEDASALLVATHLALCPSCRARTERLDALGGALWRHPGQQGEEDAALEATLGALLARIDAGLPDEPPRAALPPAGPGDVPMPLRALTGPLDAVPFRRAGPGILRFDLPLSRPDRPVCLVSLRPGLRVPDHRHAATERGLVLRGGFTDEEGHFVRGDVSIRGPDEAHPHQQRIDPGERCVVLMVDDGPKLPTTPLGWIVDRLFRI